MKNKLIPIFLYGTLASAFILVALCTFWLLAPYRTIEFKGDYQTAKTSYKQGDKTYYNVNYCKYTSAPVSIVKEFTDGLVFTVDSPRPILPLGCREMQVPMTIPDSLPAGTYRLRNTITYHVNPIRDETVIHYSNWFTVKTNWANPLKGI